VIPCENRKIVVKQDLCSPSESPKVCWRFFGRTHECAGSRGSQYHLVDVPSKGRSNRLGGRSNRLGQECRQKPKIATPGGTLSGTVRLGLF
jgi:hypothetical protein